MIKATQAFLAGLFFAFILDFFFFLGIQLHYIDYYGIDVVYNLLFADHQSWIVFFLLTLLLGYLTIYLHNLRKAALILALVFALDLTLLLPPVGRAAGALLFQQPDTTLYDSRYRYRGTLYYEGRDALGDRAVWIWDEEENRIFKLMQKALLPTPAAIQ
jgi:hypothetical protein